MSSREDLVVLALRVLPGKLREWLQEKRDRPEKEKKGGRPVRCDARASGTWRRKVTGGKRSRVPGVRARGTGRNSGEEVRCLRGRPRLRPWKAERKRSERLHSAD
jgi:hypothetical protein